MAYDDQQIANDNQQLSQRLEEDRALWADRIKGIVRDTKQMNKLADVQVSMLSFRQMLIDKTVEFKNILYRRKSSWDKYFKVKYREYSINYDVKLNSSEKASFIKADLSALKTQINMIETHIEYYGECIRTLDNMAFAIRNRIKLNEDDF
tara:strand:- start:278 stop:727 length:450 start_codon:yes stop_codon:yes gene_type:complete